jgi:hypothetical protein
VDLGAAYPVAGTTFYGRTDCCAWRAKGMRFQLLDAAGGLIAQQSLPTAATTQTLSWTSPPPPTMARFVRVLPNPALPVGDNCIQISQLVVADPSGHNLALRKPTRISSSWPGSSPDTAVDGTLQPRAFPSVAHDGCVAGSPTPAFWMVDLGAVLPVARTVFYGRTDCCQARAAGMRVQLLDANQAVLQEQALMTDDTVQTLLWTGMVSYP